MKIDTENARVIRPMGWGNRTEAFMAFLMSTPEGRDALAAAAADAIISAAKEDEAGEQA